MPVRKSGVATVVVALSGGVDSAVAGLFMSSCVRTVADVIALSCTPWRPFVGNAPNSTALLDVIRSRTPWSRIVYSSGFSWNKHDHPVLGRSDRPLRYLPVFMRNWEDDDGSRSGGWCEQSRKDYDDATASARLIGLIPRDDLLKELNFSADYIHHCFDPMLSEYRQGRTLNADILCNAEIKFGSLLNHCRKYYGAEALVTGHYARTVMQKEGAHCASESSCAVSSMVLARPRTAGKDLNDQTVFLSRLTPSQIARAIFPLGHLVESKQCVRDIARAVGLTAVASKKTSTGLCFVSTKTARDQADCAAPHFPSFLDHFIDESCAVTAKSSGLEAYTRFFLVDSDAMYNLPNGKRLHTELSKKGSSTEVTLVRPYKGGQLLSAHSLTIGEKVTGSIVTPTSTSSASSEVNSHGKQAVREMYVCEKHLCEEQLNGEEWERSGELHYLSQVILVPRWNHPRLYTQTLRISNVSFAIGIFELIRYGSLIEWNAGQRLGRGRNGLPCSTTAESGGADGWRALECLCCCRHQEPLRLAFVLLKMPTGDESGVERSTVPQRSGGPSTMGGRQCGPDGWVALQDPVRAATPGQAVVMYLPERRFCKAVTGGKVENEDEAADLGCGEDQYVVVASGWIVDASSPSPFS